MRDIVEVIDRIKAYIPRNDGLNSLILELDHMTHNTCYRSPEGQTQGKDWVKLSILLQAYLGDPVPGEFSEKIAGIMAGRA